LGSDVKRLQVESGKIFSLGYRMKKYWHIAMLMMNGTKYVEKGHFISIPMGQKIKFRFYFD
jgi:hypothetical protein